MVSSGMRALRLEMNVGDQPFVVHAALLWDEIEVILVDTGIPGQLELIREAVEKEGISFDRLTKIIITHQDRDHIGSLPELVAAFGGKVQVLAHEIAVPYLAGETPLIKSGALAPYVKVDQTLQDKELLPDCGGIEIIYTPGHSPDHISLYHRPSKTLISGDALTSRDGVLMPFDPKFTPDKETALLSVGKLLDYDIDHVITYHGGVCSGGIKERLNEIVENPIQ
ncbi:MBL fold metallo-hydrolase [Brevibacillus invocatus]|uniref:MBL fold metallo-hydrolase n=1 Tax=Brevibacillus invocatus TaxID=173959 RepID=A0A3M8C6R7_9BACL|nr:MBL fold metallo-hydrolase [Brevibacillus invocatus]MCM3078594.1 MBL fold metallo-hydrolase [Brevibacillus invocatus]MCM3429157.1 MBL fold metallo-hydrolase [Brevibacillus invocatus]RNB71251.1 MBL fold metallo-hydrolase [Brevibacillus invocatus]